MSSAGGPVAALRYPPGARDGGCPTSARPRSAARACFASLLWRLQILRAERGGLVPHLLPLLVEHQGGIGRRDHPGATRHLALELARSPARIAEHDHALGRSLAARDIAHDLAAGGHGELAVDLEYWRPGI